jgi:hypothetical protein
MRRYFAMTSRTKVLLFVAAAASLGTLIAQAQKKPAIAYPDYPNDPRHWRHVRTMVIYSKDSKLYDRFGGLHNVYVNDLGWEAFRLNRTFPDGSMFAMELYDISSAQGTIQPRGRKFLAVMKKNAKLYRDTGGWGFEIFKGDEKTGSLKDMKECFSCHTSQKSKDYVQSAYMQ